MHLRLFVFLGALASRSDKERIVDMQEGYLQSEEADERRREVQRPLSVLGEMDRHMDRRIKTHRSRSRL